MKSPNNENTIIRNAFTAEKAASRNSFCTCQTLQTGNPVSVHGLWRVLYFCYARIRFVCHRKRGLGRNLPVLRLFDWIFSYFYYSHALLPAPHSDWIMVTGTPCFFLVYPAQHFLYTLFWYPTCLFGTFPTLQSRQFFTSIHGWLAVVPTSCTDCLLSTLPLEQLKKRLISIYSQAVTLLLLSLFSGNFFSPLVYSPSLRGALCA